MALILTKVFEQDPFSVGMGQAFGPFRQIQNIECLHFRLKTEMSDELRVYCMWLNNSSVYTGYLNISRN